MMDSSHETAKLQYDEIAQWLGLEPLEDTNELLQSISRLTPKHSSSKQVSTHAAAAAVDDTKPSPEAMGNNDISNVLYVNFVPRKLPHEAQDKLNRLLAELNLNTNWLSLRAGVETQKKITAGQLPSGMSVPDQMKRAVYRAKITDYLIHNSSWMGIFANQGMQRKFSVNKSEFHLTLLSGILDGLTVSTSVYSKLEGILKTISDGISQTSSSSVKTMYWILLTVYTWDTVQKVVRPSVRTVFFEVNQSTYNYVSNKSNVSVVNFELGYMQMDAIFNSAVFENGIEPTIQAYLAQQGTNIINQPIDIPVDP